MNKTEILQYLTDKQIPFTKYEHDDVIQSKAMNTLIEAADQVPDITAVEAYNYYADTHGNRQNFLF